jgi:dihydrofolate synthase/folylpolyglutamate synthase
MRQISNFAEAKNALTAYVSSSGVYTLDTMKALMTYLGDPQNTLKIIHVAGTSGKTSTSYFAAALLHAAGYNVGLTTSPHIDEINERAQINLVPLPEAEYTTLLNQFLDLVDKSKLQPSYFELLVAFAYWVFAKKKVDYAVIEVGLGGLLDATNVVDRRDKMCIITDIGLDHTAILGNTLTEIAAQKSGIISPQNVVFAQAQPDVVMEVFQEAIGKNNATLNVIGGNFSDEMSPMYAALPLFQKRNFTLTYAAVSFTLQRDKSVPLGPEHIAQALAVYIPARMEVVEYQGKTLVMDGSHNEQKIGALVRAMSARFDDADTAILVSFGTLKEPSVRDSLRLLRDLGSTLIVTRYTEGQDEVRVALDPEIIATLAHEVGFTTIITEEDPIKALASLVDIDVPVHLITGSFYLLNHYRTLIRNN